MEKRVTMAELLPFIEESFSRGQKFKIPITGTSMNPLLYQNRDFVYIVKPCLPLNIGDIPLYRRKDGAFVLHRVVGIENGTYIMCGDNQVILEKGIENSQIIGVVSDFLIDGKEFSADNPQYSKFKNKFTKNIGYRYPKRRLVLYVKKIIGRA